MKISEDIQFWHDNFAMRIQSDLDDPNLTPGLMYIHDSNTGPKNLRLGSQGHLYYCDTQRAVSYGFLIGSERPDHTHNSGRDKTIVPKRDIISLLINEAKPPFMVGEIGLRSPINSFKVSYSRQQVHFCIADSSLTFNLDKLAALIKLCDGIPTALVMQAFDLYNHYTFNRDRMSDVQMKRFQKVLSSHPPLSEAIRIEGLTHGCGELEAFRWSRHTEKKTEPVENTTEEQS